MNLARLKDKHIAALYRCAKTRGYAFFRNPRAMIELRAEYQRRFP